MEKREVILKIKPKYNIFYEAFLHCEIAIIIVLFLIASIRLKLTLGYVLSIFVGIVWVLYLVLTKIKSKSYYYCFYQDKMKYKNRFFTNKEYKIEYSKIKSIYYYQNLMQRIARVGDITLVIKGFSLINSKITLHSIEKSEEIYKQLNNIILGQK